MNLGRGNVTLHASAFGPKIGSFLPQTFSIGGLILYLMPAADRRVGLLRQLRIAKPFGVLDLRRLDVQQTDVHRALLGLAGDRIGIRSSTGRRDAGTKTEATKAVASIRPYRSSLARQCGRMPGFWEWRSRVAPDNAGPNGPDAPSAM
jgi:hypothetical protein